MHRAGSIFSTLSVSVVLLVLLASAPCWGGIQESRSQLEKIRARIERAQKDLQHKKRSELNLSRELALVRRTLKDIDRQLRRLKKEVGTIDQQLRHQEQQIAKSRRAAATVTEQLKRRLVALYKEGDVGPLKILFSADSVTAMVQQYQYLSRVLEHDKELLEEYRHVIEQRKRQLAELESLKKKKLAALDKVKQQRQVADKGRRLQARLLQKARSEKKQLATELAQLKSNAARLQTLVKRLETSAQSVSGRGAGSFAVGRGKLAWPVAGRVIIGFGQQKDQKLGTYYESNGIEIATPPGSPVRAVAAGKVVFADYFKGYGNLYILSHPGGYHTLYAQLKQMVKQAGDRVSAGDLLGKSGLDGRGSIYFEIRSKGSPVNPLAWLKRH